MTFKELLAAKHPTTWLEFERGDINEDVALSRFWADGRAVDGTALRNMLVRISSAVLEEPSVLQAVDNLAKVAGVFLSTSWTTRCNTSWQDRAQKRSRVFECKVCLFQLLGCCMGLSAHPIQCL
jgi:hypothetical protein